MKPCRRKRPITRYARSASPISSASRPCVPISIFSSGRQNSVNRRSTTFFCFGPPGLGKTTLAQIIARELGVSFRATSGPVIARAGDLAALLTNLQPHDVLFIDEIHRLAAPVEEILYPAMEDFQLDLIIGEGPAARSVRIDLPPFTLIGATTRSGLITRPLRENVSAFPCSFAILRARKTCRSSLALRPKNSTCR